MSIARRLISIEAGQVRPFKFTIATGGANTQFELPLTSPSGKQPNIVVDWGDGSGTTTITSALSSDRFHTYSSAGTYQIIVNGYCPGFNVDNNTSYKGLYRSVDDWGQVEFEQIDFYGCSNLTTIPADVSNNATLNEGLNTVLRFNSTFRQTGLTIIPAGLFDYASNVTSFVNTFVFIGIPSIPSGLFDNNTQVVNFESVFRNCRSITSIPANFFSNNQSVTTFANAFNMATTANSLGGTTPTDTPSGDEIFERTPTPVGTDCFAFCSGLTNFGSIPATFK
jgi:hypothetical protein